MLLTGIITAVDYERRSCTVEITDLANAATSTPVVLDAVILESPGIQYGYHQGDFVWLGFVRDETHYPVVLGKLHSIEQQIDNIGGHFVAETLEISNAAQLPVNTVFADVDVDYNSISSIIGKLKTINNFVEKHQNLEADLLNMSDNLTISYTNTAPILKDFGGILAKNHVNGFNAVPITDLLTELLYPYTEPEITNFSINSFPSTAVYEYGTHLTISNISLAIKQTSQAISSIIIKQNNNIIKTFDTADISIDASTNTFSTNFSCDIVLDGQSDVTFTIEVSDDTTTTVSSAASIFFVYPYYKGYLDLGDVATASIVLNGEKILRRKGNYSGCTYNTQKQAPFLAFPASYGTLSKITDHNNFKQNWENFTVTLDIGGNSVEYYVYVGDNTTATGTYAFSY
jgi:hypothetical protein